MQMFCHVIVQAYVLTRNKNVYWRLLGYPCKACGKIMLYTDHTFKCDLLNPERLLSDCGRSEYGIVRIVRPRFSEHAGLREKSGYSENI